MENFITYLFQSTLCLTFFLLFYFLVLKNETYHLENRFYLLITSCFSFIIPLFKFGIPGGNDYTNEITIYLAPVFIKSKEQTIETSSLLSNLPEVIYFTVVSVLFLKFIVRLIQLLLIIKKNETVTIEGLKIIILEKETPPFSFFNRIFLTKAQVSDEAIDKIIAHEKTHIAQYHSLDIILMELIKIIHWFNPLAWKYKKEIEAQHEFSADSRLISSGINVNEYKSVLMAYSFGIGGSGITNNFNSLLKRRFEMLSRKKSRSSGKVKLLFTLPLILILVMLTGVVNGGISLKTAKGQTGEKNPTTPGLQEDEKIYTYVDQMPDFPGGEGGLKDFLATNIKYPEAAKNEGIQGKIYIQFVVDKDGSITEVKVAKGLSTELNNEAVRVVNTLPKWKPGKHKGEIVKVRIAIPIMFKLD